MGARINHIAISSDQYAINGKFYEALFGMRPSARSRPANAVVVKDGYLGLNNNARHEGCRSGLDHFGIEVDDLEAAIARIAAFDPALEVVKRPSARPFAAYSAHDPDGNVFDLSQRDGGAQKDVYADATWEQPRRVGHLALRTLHAERCAAFYAEVFGLTPARRPGDERHYLSDGRVTLVVIPWRITDYEGHNPMPLGLDHIGFVVESVDALKREMEALLRNPRLRTWDLGKGSEARARLELLRRCPLGTYHLTDVDGVYIDVAEEREAGAAPP